VPQPSTPRDALTAIAELLAPGEPAVAERAAHAHDDPDGYVRAHAAQLDLRGIDEPEPNLAWIALIDALDDHGLLAEVDWREADGDVVEQLRELRSSPAPEAWAWWPERNELATYEFLQLAGDRLRAGGTALAVLDIESDCYPLVLLPAARATELVALATAAGFVAEQLVTRG
jgi:uncharacterized protein DUF6630